KQIRQLSLILVRDVRSLIPQSQIHGQVRAHSPVILNVGAHHRKAHTARSCQARKHTPNSRWSIGQETAQVPKEKTRHAISGIRDLVELVALEARSELHGMEAFGHEGIIVDLVRIPGELVNRWSYTGPEQCESGHLSLGRIQAR